MVKVERVEQHGEDEIRDEDTDNITMLQPRIP